MALADPQSVDITGTPDSLPRTGISLNEGSFANSSGTVELTVRHEKARRIRHVVKLTQSSIVSDPMVPSNNIPVSASAHIVIDMPRNGVSVADAVDIARALVVWATEQNLEKVCAGES